MPARVSKKANNPGVAGLVLPGGGARGAYQVGVLKAIAEMTPDGVNPFQVLTGTSVGAINAVSIATRAGDFAKGVERLAGMWSGLHAKYIYRTDFRAVGANSLRWFLSLVLGGLGPVNPESLLDNEPLRELLTQSIDFARIETAIRSGALRAVGITASGIEQGNAVTFFQGSLGVQEWRRVRREGRREALSVDHMMASSALPFLFPAHRIGNEYFADGSLRLTSPLSPAIHLGAQRLLVIGVRRSERKELSTEISDVQYPSLGNLAGHMLDLLFMDNIQSDIERLQRINRTLSLLPETQRAMAGLRKIELVTIEPVTDMREIARRHASEMPWTIRKLLSGVGAWDREWRLASYLLFEPGYIKEIIDLGYADAMQRQSEIRALLGFRS